MAGSARNEAAGWKTPSGVGGTSDMRQSGYKRGFTLIELLVVIAIIALLMAILVPTLRRARNQGLAVVCQSRQKQWGLLMDLFVNDHGGRFMDPAYNESRWDDYAGVLGLVELCENQEVPEDLLYCPMATKFPPGSAERTPYGGTFSAYKDLYGQSYSDVHPRGAPGSYGTSAHLGWRWHATFVPDDKILRTIEVRGGNRIPVLLDSGLGWLHYGRVSEWTPPECDAIPTIEARGLPVTYPACINRHDGGVNTLFLDWSVRKVGLKELWTLQWYKGFDTGNKWTKAGGAEPDDWPQWMRGFKDY